MPDIEINSTIKAVAAVTALFAAYFSSSDWLKALLAKLNPLKTPPIVANTAQVDEAVRVLLQDSQDRKCRKSVQLLNDWIEARNLFSIPETTEGPKA